MDWRKLDMNSFDFFGEERTLELTKDSDIWVNRNHVAAYERREHFVVVHTGKLLLYLSLSQDPELSDWLGIPHGS